MKNKNKNSLGQTHRERIFDGKGESLDQKPLQASKN